MLDGLGHGISVRESLENSFMKNWRDPVGVCVLPALVVKHQTHPSLIVVGR
jgi:hypothetical protein